MTPHVTQDAQHAEHRWLSPLRPSIVAALSLIATVDPASLAAAAGCQVTEAGGTIYGMPTGKGTSSRMLPRTLTVERASDGRLVPSPVREDAMGMRSSRITWGDPEDQGIATINAWLSQDICTSALFTHAMFPSIDKTQTNAHTRVMKVSPLPYNGKRHVHTIRTTPPKIGIAARNTPATIIGSIQEIHTSILADARRASQTVTARLSTVEAPVLFGDQPFVAVSPLQNAQQLPDNETLRMNMSSAQILHGGNCGSGCP